MSIQINWDALTSGPDGEALAETIRAFIHDKFQQVTLPRFIRSVKVHSFNFGTVTPELEIKDVCDPLPDFYEEDEDGSSGSDDENIVPEATRSTHGGSMRGRLPHLDEPHEPNFRSNLETLRSHQRNPLDPSSMAGIFARSSFNPQNNLLSRVSTPGIPGGTSHMGYFHLPLSGGLSGAATPLATAVGAPFANGWPEQYHTRTYDSDERSGTDNQTTDSAFKRTTNSTKNAEVPIILPSKKISEKSAEDVQIVMRFKYSGDVKLSLTADILLDYPMPSFVGIPLKLNVTGLSFDGVAIVAYIKRKAHCCFLGPEDADALVGHDVDLTIEESVTSRIDRRSNKPIGGLFEEIKVESEIGQKTNGKQVLKNVGKVEKFVLEQVRKIFESEFVYPSYWTFLV